jgi:hypothetical protein
MLPTLPMLRMLPTLARLRREAADRWSFMMSSQSSLFLLLICLNI